MAASWPVVQKYSLWTLRFEPRVAFCNTRHSWDHEGSQKRRQVQARSPRVSYGTVSASARSSQGVTDKKVEAMKVLVVEDNAKLAHSLQRALQEAGHVTDTLEDGRAAIERCKTVEYDVMILDWMLPETDGISICRSLRDRGVNTPIMILTARVDVSDRIMGLDAGADDYLTKPFDLGELLARVRALGRRGMTSESVVKVGPLALDRLERHATVNGRPVDLTPREFELLTYLAKQSGRVVPRQELLQQVWETHVESCSNVVDAHVKKVREKLGEFAGLVETVRGVGYCIGSSQAAA